MAPLRAHFLVFRLDGQRYALDVSSVERVIRAVELTPLPNAPALVLGVVDLAGQLLPVFNVRRRFRLPEREILPSDQLLIVRTSRRTVVLAVDEALNVFDHAPSALVAAAQIVPGIEHIQSVVKLDDGLVLIHDIEHFLSAEEDCVLGDALSGTEVAH